MSPPKKTVLEPLRLRVRRFQFIAGLGFLALILGSVLSVSLAQRINVRVQALPFALLRSLIDLGLQKLWVLAVLPGLAYVAARIIDLRPWPTALGSAAAGQVFLLALEYVQGGVDGWVERGVWNTLWEVGALALGVGITSRAVERGRAAVKRQGEQAQVQAAARQGEYDEFLQAAEREGEKIAQREAARAEAQAAAAPPAAPADAPAPPVAPKEEPSEPPPSTEPKSPSA